MNKVLKPKKIGKVTLKDAKAAVKQVSDKRKNMNKLELVAKVKELKEENKLIKRDVEKLSMFLSQSDEARDGLANELANYDDVLSDVRLGIKVLLQASGHTEDCTPNPFHLGLITIRDLIE